jgi:uncharacterized membrane protein
MIKVEAKITIERAPDEVFAYLTNFENNPLWQSGMVTARFTSDPPLGVGSTYTQVAKFLGRRVDSTFAVVDFEPGRLVKITSTSGSFPITVTRTVEPAGSGSLVRAAIEGDASGFFRLAEPLMRRLVQRSVTADYDRLKEILEAAGS